MHHRATWLLIMQATTLITAAALADTPAQPASYDAHFQRPYAAGQKYAVAATDTVRASQQTQTPDGQGARTNQFQRLLLEADVTIDKVDADRQPAALTLVIGKLTEENNVGGQDVLSPVQALLPPGTVIRAVIADGQPGFVDRSGHDIPDQAIVILNRTFAPSPMKDAICGSAQRKKVGDSWPANTKAIPVDRLNPQAVDPADLSGDVTLKAVEKVAGIDCARFEVTLTTDKVNVGDVKPTEAKMTIQESEALPLDPAKPAIAGSTKTTMHVVVEQKPLGKGVVKTTLDSETSHEVTWTGK